MSSGHLPLVIEKTKQLILLIHTVTTVPTRLSKHKRLWLFKIGKADDPRCRCGEIQNAAHLLASGCVGNMKRNRKDIWTDREFCGAVTRFLNE